LGWKCGLRLNATSDCRAYQPIAVAGAGPPASRPVVVTGPRKLAVEGPGFAVRADLHEGLVNDRLIAPEDHVQLLSTVTSAIPELEALPHAAPGATTLTVTVGTRTFEIDLGTALQRQPVRQLLDLLRRLS
jgi:hypothetical protein